MIQEGKNMNKKHIILLSCLLIAALLAASIPHVNAVDTSDDCLIGDVDLDGSLTIIDATVIQRRLAGMRTLSELAEFLADTDGDRELTIIDAAQIQRRLADLPHEFWMKSINRVQPRIYSLNHYSNYPSTAYNKTVFEDTEVRIYFNAYRQLFFGREIENRYDVYINDRKVADRLTRTYYDCLFSKAGVYNVTVVPSNVFGSGESLSGTITVTGSPDKPYIAGAKYDAENHLLRVHASGGAGEYRFRYYIRYIVAVAPTEPETECPTEGEPYTPPFNPKPMPNGTFQMVSDYTDASFIRIPVEMLEGDLEYDLYVSVIDKNGSESSYSRVISL